jgi:hypothetical protein
MQACRDLDQDLFRSPDLFDVEVLPGVPLYRLLFEPMADLPIDKITLRNAQAALYRCVDWTSRVDVAPEPDVLIAGTACVSPTAALVHARIAASQGAACLCLAARSDRAGILPVQPGLDTKAIEVHFLTKAVMLPAFYQSLFEVEELGADAYMANAVYAFPQIAFVPGLASQFTRFQTPYREVRRDVTLHLRVLHDNFQRVFEEQDHKPHETSKVLSSLGVDASPESPGTRANKKAMKEREVDIDHVTVGLRKLDLRTVVRCEWHTKIRPTTDRIHFHPGAKGLAEGRLIVGIFVHHLST